MTTVQDIKTGTTTVGLIYDKGVVLAADMRASMGHIAYDEESEKIYDINGVVGVTNAGNVGDSLTIIRFLKSHAKVYELERNQKMTARAATTYISNILNGNRYYPYIVQLILGGFNGKPELFDLTPYGGVLERDKYAVSGSGTEQALNTLDLGYKKGMAEKEAIALGISAIESGKRRDLYSGGMGVTVFVIDKQGVRKIPKEQVEKIAKDAGIKIKS
ncbi:MAG: proteasome subunit beta [archaeon]|nr:proteasome subunit beta [archaeon]